MRAVVPYALAAALAGCSLGRFDELRDRAWADSSGTPNGIAGEDYPVAIAALATDRPGLHAAALARAPLGLATISYSVAGSIESRGIALEGAVDGGSPTIVAATDPVAGADGAVVVGGVGDTLFLYDARTGALGPELRRTIDSSACMVDLPQLGEHMVYAPTDLGDDDAPDLIVTAGNYLVAFPDLTPSSADTCYRCFIAPSTAGTRPIRSLLAVDFDAPSGHELLIGLDTGVYAVSARWIEDNHPAVTCGMDSTHSYGDYPLDGAGVGFGGAMAAGDADAQFHKVAIWAPAMSRVFVFRGLGRGGPPGAANVTSVTVDGASPSFGQTLAFADLDRDGTDELVVGDPDVAVEGNAGAGRLTVFALRSEDPLEYERLADLHDARPEPDQRFGRALATAEFVTADDADTLLVGAAYELFTYFRALTTQPDPRE